ncbi:MAG: glycosyltransferase family 9 protein [Verrucomicrobiota bacterium]|jgi:ADP-heptose:LPS heptosyltransferase
MPEPDNILIYRLGSLGDTVVALPCFHLVRKVYPDSKITLLTNWPVSVKAPLAMSILDNSGLCDDTIGYPVSTRSIAALAAIRESIRRLRPRVLINLVAARGFLSSLRDYAFFRSCGIGVIVGTPFSRRDRILNQLADGNYEPESSRLASRLGSLGALDLGDRSLWMLGLSPMERNQAAALLRSDCKPFLAVSVGTKLPVNDWGDQNWKILLTLLAREKPQATLVLLGSAGEWERSEELSRVWTGRHLNLCGRTASRISAAVLERCSLFIGHDSGPMHLAGAMGTPTLGLFSWYNPPGKWFPGHRSWEFIRVLYPRLPAGGWNQKLRMKNTASEGIQLLKPGHVFRSAMVLWNSFDSKTAAGSQQFNGLSKSKIYLS